MILFIHQQIDRRAVRKDAFTKYIPVIALKGLPSAEPVPVQSIYISNAKKGLDVQASHDQNELIAITCLSRLVES